jgi:predicted GTPase
MDYADVIVLVVDASVGPQADDLVVADMLRRSDKPVLLAANKVDSDREESEAARFYSLGLGDPHPVSALHGRGSGATGFLVGRPRGNPGPPFILSVVHFAVFWNDESPR